MMEEIADLVKSARYQVGTFSHGSDDYRPSLAGVRAAVEGMNGFLSDRRRAAAVAATVILLASLINFLRGWIKVLRARS